MRQVPNYTVTVLARSLPLILDAVKPDPTDSRMANAIRLTRKQVKKLKAIAEQAEHENTDP